MSTSGAASGGSSLPDPVTIAHGGTGQITAGPAFDALAPTTTRGDLIARGAATNGRLALPTGGQGVVSDGTDVVGGNATTVQQVNGVSPSGAITSTIPRYTGFASSVSITRGTLYLCLIGLAKGTPISTISFFSTGTHSVTPTNQIFGLYDLSKNRLAVTADDGTTAWAASTAKTLTVTGAPFVVPATAAYYVALMVAGSAGSPSMFGISGNATVFAVAPIMGGNTNDTGLTTTLPNPYGTLTSGAQAFSWVA